MRLVSTGGSPRAVSFGEALFESLAPDGGLFTPEKLQPLDGDTLRRLHGEGFPAVARTLARHLLGGELAIDELDRIVADALDFGIPLVDLDGEIRMLELFHGPTLAFKDVGARFMARTMSCCRPRGRRLTILVATSGDTGSAVAHAFRGLGGTRIVVLFPDGQVSPLQERQFSTLGGNVSALAVQGTFDDCQRLAKAAFADPAICERVPLTSANSINIGRLLPQIFYYFGAWAQLPDPDGELVFCVPSGNFGNLTAGLMARRLGLPVSRFVAATNANDVVPEYLMTGDYRPRASLRTISNAMDVGDPSNLARILHLFGGDLHLLRDVLDASSHDDDATRAVMGDVHRRTGTMLDPHTAVGYLGLREHIGRRNDQVEAVLLATAHPAKFGDVVREAIGVEVPLPDRLAACLARDREVTSIDPTLDDLKTVLLED